VFLINVAFHLNLRFIDGQNCVVSRHLPFEKLGDRKQ
jgi:hypothetical protein